jgi:hypothetical protein
MALSALGELVGKRAVEEFVFLAAVEVGKNIERFGWLVFVGFQDLSIGGNGIAAGHFQCPGRRRIFER